MSNPNQVGGVNNGSSHAQPATDNTQAATDAFNQALNSAAVAIQQVNMQWVQGEVQRQMSE